MHSRYAKKIRQDIKDFRFRWDGHAFEVGVSMGLAHVDENSDSIATILSNADAACYEAKEAGRNCVKISDRNDSEGTEKEVQWSSESQKRWMRTGWCCTSNRLFQFLAVLNTASIAKYWFA
ncbi:MAG: diguanylate cyclase [Cycloclasticus sp.]|nr:diguanylate cyclase [Cycloclasticus sp.]